MLRRAIFLILFEIILANRLQCMTFCHEDCDSLNGNIAHECGSCTHEYKCNSLATNFRPNDHHDAEAKLPIVSLEDSDPTSKN